MRIISGKARGTNLYTLEGQNTRPTSDRAKEALFNIIGNEAQNKIFLDLFSGSGAVALEAISRGAKKAIICEKSKEAFNVIKKNVQKTHFEEYVELHNEDYKNTINKLKEKPDYIFLDPPYNSDLIYQSVKTLIENNILKEDSIIILETDNVDKIEKEIKELEIEIFDKRKYGKIHFIFAKAKEVSS